jgi:phage baseplate assembly protein W
MSYDLKLTYGDLVIKNGDVQTVVDSEKLGQDILKICLTSAGTNPFNPWYGSYLSRCAVGNPQDTSVIVQISKSQLDTSLNNLKYLQELQIKSFQKVSADEQISAISGINVTRNQFDPRLYDIKIKVITKGLKPITTSFNVSTI